ncbi:MAG: hypothetical protein QME55_12505 [Brevundimonas sp.]|uniref:hypothetical protein n=1 Tax=Brevundimonas sp. TaxID=1871086 RepID=UPI002617CB07|nr:hypothetical protein [Brevundimonas sp.]MDI6625545.1 hypothetical protein [Brevundimonas sp.]MDQ7781039.1 hypothetical protein [Planctomycetota bacterium]
MDLLKQAENATEAGPAITRIASRYKSKTDQLLQPRHRGVHEYEHHHSLIKQLETLELLTSPAVGDVDFIRAMEFQRDSASRRAKRLVLSELSKDDAQFLELTDASFGEAFDIQKVWRFSS